MKQNAINYRTGTLISSGMQYASQFPLAYAYNVHSVLTWGARKCPSHSFSVQTSHYVKHGN
eukprot:1159016-Pelagomonas_calceolata.AAC.15